MEENLDQAAWEVYSTGFLKHDLLREKESLTEYQWLTASESKDLYLNFRGLPKQGGRNMKTRLTLGGKGHPQGHQELSEQAVFVNELNYVFPRLHSWVIPPSDVPITRSPSAMHSWQLIWHTRIKFQGSPVSQVSIRLTSQGNQAWQPVCHPCFSPSQIRLFSQSQFPTVTTKGERFYLGLLRSTPGGLMVVEQHWMDRWEVTLHPCVIH